MQRFLIKFIVLSAMLIGLPLLGVVIAGYPVARYLEFPPISRYIDHAPFSWIAYWGYIVFISIFVAPLIVRRIQSRNASGTNSEKSHPFLWWGWCGVGFGAVAWIFAFCGDI